MSGIIISLISPSLWAATGEALIKGTQSTDEISGFVILEDTKKGLKIKAEINNAPPGDHGFHIHEFGSCADSGKAAGGHYNPSGARHGRVAKVGIKKAHGGDLGNVSIGEDGKGSVEVLVKKLSLNSGKYNVAGRAFIVHAKPDTFKQPTGEAGARIACGSIVVTSH